jgi:mRNA interferase RelE/StbE
MSWEVRLSNPATNFLRKLKNSELLERIMKQINKLSDGPYSLPYEKLSGEDGIYRIRIGDYRAMYSFEEGARIVYILKIGYRKNVYD